MENKNIDFEYAMDILQQKLQKLKRTEIKYAQTGKAAGRILAEDLYAPLNIPPFHRSPLDGYAVRSEDIRNASEKDPVQLKVTECVFAGEYILREVREGEAVRIMTGAPVPEGADCVVRQEDTDMGDNWVNIYKDIRKYQNYVFKGDDIKKGTLLLQRGTRLSAVEIGLLSGMGIRDIYVYKKPRIALFAFGDELCEAGELEEGQIFDMNLQMLRTRCLELKNKIVMSEILKDDISQAIMKLNEAKDKADLIITTGSVSVGKKDIMPRVIEKMKGEIFFRKVKMKPGSPIIFWGLENTPVISLSGNPFAALATFELFARPVIERIMGYSGEVKWWDGIITKDYLKKSPHCRFVRARYENGYVEIPDNNSSGALCSMRNCNCLIELPAGDTGKKAGDRVKILLL